jgi:hypothetical protein
MGKKNISGFIRPVRAFAKYIVNKHCLTVIFCLFPFFGEAVALELGELSSRNIKPSYEVTHGSGVLIAADPSGMRGLEHGHCGIKGISEYLGCDKVSSFSRKALSQPVFYENADQVPSDATKSSGSKNSDNLFS